MSACPYETAARRAGWAPRFSAFTRCGVTIAYVNWKTLCLKEGIPPASQSKNAA